MEFSFQNLEGWRSHALKHGDHKYEVSNTTTFHNWSTWHRIEKMAGIGPAITSFGALANLQLLLLRLWITSNRVVYSQIKKISTIFPKLQEETWHY